MRTSPRVSFGLYALEVKPDLIPTASGVQSFSKPEDLRTDNASELPYASYEPDFWLLDGGYKFLPADLSTVHVGIMSMLMSDADGYFAAPPVFSGDLPVLILDFSTVHTTDGLTLRFSQYTGDFASRINVQYFDDTTTLIRGDDYYPTSWEFTTSQPVANFKKIVITFYSTNRPYRYLRLSGIEFGELIYFEGSSIKQADLVEETDMLSSECRFDTLDLRLYTRNAAFSIINPTGYYAYLQSRQPIAVHEIVGGRSIFMGQFYLDKWENQSETEITFRCIDLLGVLDTITYDGGMFSGVAIETLIDDMLAPIYAPYDLDPTLAGTTITGWIPSCSYREALQQIAFSAGAYVDCSRSGAIKIYKSPDLSTDTPTGAITRSQKGMGQSLALKPLVTGVSVTAHNYVSVSTSKQVYNGTLAAGTHKITFNEPLHDLSVSGATISSSGVNYAILTVASPGTVTLSGQIYLDTTQSFTVVTAGLSTAIKPNVLKVTDATLVNSANGQAVAQRVYDHFQWRYLQKVKLYAPTDIQTGDVITVDTLYNKQLKCVIEKMAIDLRGGMIAQVEMTGIYAE